MLSTRTNQQSQDLFVEGYLSVILFFKNILKIEKNRITVKGFMIYQKQEVEKSDKLSMILGKKAREDFKELEGFWNKQVTEQCDALERLAITDEQKKMVNESREKLKLRNMIVSKNRL